MIEATPRCDGATQLDYRISAFDQLWYVIRQLPVQAKSRKEQQRYLNLLHGVVHGADDLPLDIEKIRSDSQSRAGGVGWGAAGHHAFMPQGQHRDQEQ